MRQKGVLPLSHSIIAALLGCWALLVLLQFEIYRWFNFSAVAKALTPALPPEQFSFGLARDLILRLAIGHGGALVWIAASAGLGLGAYRWVRPGGRPGATRGVMAVGLGYAIGTLLWFALGLTGLWDWRLAWIVAIWGSWIAWRGRAAWGLGLHRRAPQRATRGDSAPTAAGVVERGALWILAGEIAVVVLLVAAACAGRELYADPLVYHLAAPSRFVMEHKVIGLPHHVQACLPLGASMAYGWQWLLAGEPAARAWRVWLVIGVLWLIWHLCAREGRSATGLVAAALFATLPLVLWHGPRTMVDMEICALVLLACLAVRLTRTTHHHLPWLILSAALTGAACSVKYTTVYWAPWLLYFCAGRNGAWKWRRALVFVGVVLLWIGPWALRNALVTGNPVFPFAGDLLPSLWSLPEVNRTVWFQELASWTPRGPGGILALPWQLGTGTTHTTFIGPAILLSLPWLLLIPLAAPAMRLYLILAVLSLSLWALSTHLARVLLATWSLLGLTAAWALWDIRARWPGFCSVALVLLALVGGANLCRMLPEWKGAFDPLDLLVCRESVTALWSRKVPNPATAVAAAADNLLPRNARILLVGECRGLYWPRSVIQQTQYDAQIFEEIIRSSMNGAEAAKRLHQYADFLYLNDAESARLRFTWGYHLLHFTPRERQVIDGLWSHWIDKIVRINRAGLYRVRRSPRREGPAPSLPVSLDEAAWRREYAPWTEMTWEGQGSSQNRIILQTQ